MKQLKIVLSWIIVILLIAFWTLLMNKVALAVPEPTTYVFIALLTSSIIYYIIHRNEKGY